MEAKDIKEVSAVVSHAINYLWDILDIIYDDELAERHRSIIKSLERAEELLGKAKKDSILKSLDCDFYSVEMDPNGDKRIHLLGYCWYCDSDDSELCYRNEMYCFGYLPLGFTEEEYDKVVDSCNHCISDYSEAGILAVMDSYGAKPLLMRNVTEDTPCGRYVDC